MFTPEMLSVGFLLLVFGGSGIVELPTWRRFAPDYVRWGYGASWAVITPVIKIFAAILTAIPQTRLGGAILCALVAIAALISVVRAKQPPRILFAAILCMLTLAAVAELFLLHADEAAAPLN